MGRFRRTRKLIRTELQLKLVLVFLVVSFACVMFQVLLLNRSILALSRGMVVERDILLDGLPRLFVQNLAITSVVLLPLTFLIGILATHRIAGPIYRFEQYLAAVARGEDPGPCRIRKRDELQDLCKRINEAVAALRRDAHATAPPEPAAGSPEPEAETVAREAA